MGDFKKGLKMAMGWYLGAAIFAGVTKFMDGYLSENSESYRNAKAKMEADD